MIFDLGAQLREEKRSEPDKYVAIIAEKGFKEELDLSPWKGKVTAELTTGPGHSTALPAGRDLCFIPYYLRANRGGKGQMRVGLRAPCPMRAEESDFYCREEDTNCMEK